MKNKILGIWNYLLCGFLGFWGLAFMSTAGVFSKTVSMGNKTVITTTMYELINFNVSASLSATAVFEIFMIIISCIMLVLFLIQLLKLHSVKINFLDKLFEIKIAKKIDLVTLLAFSYTLMSLLTIICIAVFGGENSMAFNINNYIKTGVGFGPIWIFIFSAIVSAAMFFKDEIVGYLTKSKVTASASSTEVAEVSVETSKTDSAAVEAAEVEIK